MRVVLWLSALMGCAAPPDDKEDAGADERRGGGQQEADGYVTAEYFPLDGSRSWVYVNVDVGVEGLLERWSGERLGEDGGERVWVHTQQVSEAEAVLKAHSVLWSSSAAEGVSVWGWVVDDEEVLLDEPLQVLPPHLSVGETHSTDGLEAVLLEEVPAPNYWTVEEWDALHVEIIDAGFEAGPLPFAGEWWLSTSWGPGQFAPPGLVPSSSAAAAVEDGDGQNWVLAEASWAAGEE